MRNFLLAVLAVFGLVSTPVVAAGLEGMGIVLIHGKAAGGRNLGPLASELSAQGALVVQPQMSWERTYRTYDETMQEVAAHIATLQSRGARRIVLIGHSLGANIAVGFAARQSGLAGVVALAPGHWPEADNIARQTRDSVRQANAMVAAGRGQETGTFVDVNQGEVYGIATTAVAYASFFDPRGPAAFGPNASRVRAPLFWVIGTADQGAQRARGKGRRQSRTVFVNAGHRDTPRAGVGEVVRWLSSL